MNVILNTKINKNGNKVLSVKVDDARAFVIQTNQNLPLAHNCSDVTSQWLKARLLVELKAHVAQCGTKAQKQLLGV